MSERVLWVGSAPTLLDAQGQASDVNSTNTLFGKGVPATTDAVAGTVLGAHYLLVRGAAYNVNLAVDDIPADWSSVWAESREGDDAGPDTWLPTWNTAAYLLGLL